LDRAVQLLYPPAGHPAIEVISLTKRYGRGPDALTAVNDVSLNVPPGQVIGLLGPNGAGKTTTIKMIAGLVAPSSGTVRINGFDIARQRASAVRQIGAVLEGSRNVYWPLPAWENLLYFGRLKGLRAPEIKPRAERLLSDLGLWERRRQPVGGFSRGMQQKVAVAAALITNPPVLLLDEPTLGLDVEAARTFKDWVAHLAAEENKTIVLTTHQLDVAQELAGRIAVVRAGRIIADLATGDLLARYADNRFEVTVAAPLDEGASGVKLPAGAGRERDGEVTRLTLPDTNPAALYQLLADLGAADVPLVSVRRAQPDLEEVFLRLIHDDLPGVDENKPTKGAA
jgi:ABC-2 type transport system ATP-binding protein